MKTATAPVQSAVRFRNILFATDYSGAANNAIPYVKRIAKHYDADVTAMHVRTPVVNPMTQPVTWEMEKESARKEDEKHTKELMEKFAGVRTKVQIDEGGVHSRLQAAIEKNNIDLVVLGTRGRTGLGKLLLGSTAEEIVRNVACPVLTVGPESDVSRGADGNLREILYATDFTSESKIAAAYAVSLAQEFQARLVLVHVIPEKDSGDLVAPSEVTRAATELLQKLVPPEARDWCKPECMVVRGNPADKILEIAQLRESDLIVLGVKPEKGVPGASTHLPFATAHKVVSHAKCPVLTVRS